MLERMVITLVILGGLALLWLGWQYYKLRLTQSIQPDEAAPGIPTLLYFSADYCAPCKLQQQPIVDSLAAKFGESLIVRRYDVTEHPDLASRYKVLTLPTTVILDSQGHVAHINYGVASQAKLEAQLAPHQASAETGDLFGLALTPSLRDSPLPLGEGLGVRADTPPFFSDYLF